MKRIGATLVLLAALLPAATAMAGRPRMPSQPSNAAGVPLDERQATYSIVHRNADGTLSTECVKGAEAAQQAVAAPPEPANEQGEHEE